MVREDVLIKLAAYQEQLKQIEEQIQALDRQIVKLKILSFNLESLKKAKGKEVLANIGENIFIKTDLKSSDLLVNVGNKVVVKKTIDETKEMIEKQINRINKIKDELNENLQKIILEANKFIEEKQNH